MSAEREGQKNELFIFDRVTATSFVTSETEVFKMANIRMNNFSLDLI